MHNSPLDSQKKQGHDFYNQDYVIDYAIEAFMAYVLSWLMCDFVSKSAHLGHVAKHCARQHRGLLGTFFLLSHNPSSNPRCTSI